MKAQWKVPDVFLYLILTKIVKWWQPHLEMKDLGLRGQIFCSRS